MTEDEQQNKTEPDWEKYIIEYLIREVIKEGNRLPGLPERGWKLWREPESLLKETAAPLREIIELLYSEEAKEVWEGYGVTFFDPCCGEIPDKMVKLPQQFFYEKWYTTFVHFPIKESEEE